MKQLLKILQDIYKLIIIITLYIKTTNVRVSDSEPHDVLPVFVDILEEFSLLGHLMHDILTAEYRFQIQPLRLHLQPFVQQILYQQQTLLPGLFKMSTNETFYF